jgi:alcohol dehydrogenase class IV
MDALCHAIEAYWSNHSNSVTDAYALSAAKITLDALPSAFLHGDNLLMRRRMLVGSMLGGLAISNAMTTAAHAISYPMTVFYRVPHGIACGIVLPQLIRYNSGAINPDKERVLLDNLGFKTMNELADAVDCLMEKLQLPVRLRDLGIRRAHLDTIVANGFRPDRINNNPRAITSSDFKRMLEEIL